MLFHWIARGLQPKVWGQGCDFPCRWEQSLDASVSGVVLLKGCRKSLNFSCSWWSESPSPNWWGWIQLSGCLPLVLPCPQCRNRSWISRGNLNHCMMPCGCSEPDWGGGGGWSGEEWMDIKDLLVTLGSWGGFLAHSFLVPSSTVAGQWIHQLLL